jgi:hypothetical protein
VNEVRTLILHINHEHISQFGRQAASAINRVQNRLSCERSATHRGNSSM